MEVEENPSVESGFRSGRVHAIGWIDLRIIMGGNRNRIGVEAEFG